MNFSLQYTDPNSRARAAQIETDHGTIEYPHFHARRHGSHRQGRASARTPRWYPCSKSAWATPITFTCVRVWTYSALPAASTGLTPGKDLYWPTVVVFRCIPSRTGGRMEEGVTFQSHIDGSKHTFTRKMWWTSSASSELILSWPLMSVPLILAILNTLKVPGAHAPLAGTLHWAFWQYGTNLRSPAGAFPHCTGQYLPRLRKISAETIAAHGREGNAIGGLSVGEPAEEMYAMTELVTEILPKDKPRYLMGVGTPENILEGIARGIDMFDCMPTRNARHGMLYTSEGIINIKNKKWQTDFSPIDPNSTVPSSRTHSRAYLRHLFICNEILGMQLATLQNLGFYLWLVGEAPRIS